MAINFPITLPSAPGFTRFDIEWPGLTGRSGGGLAAAPQVFEWDDLPMRATCQLPVFGEGSPSPHSRVELGQWEATLLALTRGGTFLQGDPRHAALLGIGPAATVDAFPTAKLTNNAGAKTLIMRGFGAGRSGVFKRGDVLQLCKNYLLSPVAFNTSDWTKIGTPSAPTVTANAVDNPEPVPTTEADQIDFPATGVGESNEVNQDGWSRITQTAAGRAFTWSCWLRAGSALSIDMDVDDGTGSTRETKSLTAAWQRFTVTRTLALAATRIRVSLLQLASQSAKTIYAWGGILYSTELDARLHKIVTQADVDSNSNGDPSQGGTDPNIWPRLRVAAPEFSPLILANAVGTWRLGRMGIERAMDRGKLCSMGFDAVEAINL